MLSVYIYTLPDRRVYYGGYNDWSAAAPLLAPPHPVPKYFSPESTREYSNRLLNGYAGRAGRVFPPAFPWRPRPFRDTASYASRGNAAGAPFLSKNTVFRNYCIRRAGCVRRYYTVSISSYAWRGPPDVETILCSYNSVKIQHRVIRQYLFLSVYKKSF